MNSVHKDAPLSNAKITLWRTVRISYAQWFKNLSHVVRVTSFWIVLAAVLMGVADWLNGSVAVTVFTDLKSRNPQPADFRAVAAIALYVLSLLVLVLSFVDVAVNWHRRVILNESPRLFGRNLRHVHYWKYFGKLVLVLAVSAIPLTIIFGLVALDGDLGFELEADSEQPLKFDFLVPIAGSSVLFTVAFIFVRLSLVLPAATSALHLTWMQSVKLTRGNSWRLIIGLFLCGVAPGCLIDLCLGWVGFVANEMSAIEILITTGSSDLFVKQAIQHQILAASALIILPIGVGFLSSSYQQLVQTPTNGNDAR